MSVRTDPREHNAKRDKASSQRDRQDDEVRKVASGAAGDLDLYAKISTSAQVKRG